jgi:predicted signal transduction protein with EAL and GGDEF domain
MTAIRKLAKLFSVPSDRPELMVAQAMALSRQLPAMYLVLLVSASGLAFTHMQSSPLALVLVGPVVLGAACVARMIGWWRLRRFAMDLSRASRMLNGTVRVAPLLAVAFSVWSLALFSYGDAYQKAHVAFFMAITVIACVFCLMHLRAAALIVIAIVLGPMTLFLASTGEPVLQAIALNVAVVASAMIMSRPDRETRPGPAPGGRERPAGQSGQPDPASQPAAVLPRNGRAAVESQAERSRLHRGRDRPGRLQACQ